MYLVSVYRSAICIVLSLITFLFQLIAFFIWKLSLKKELYISIIISNIYYSIHHVKWATCQFSEILQYLVETSTMLISTIVALSIYNTKEYLSDVYMVIIHVLDKVLIFQQKMASLIKTNQTVIQYALQTYTIETFQG